MAFQPQERTDYTICLLGTNNGYIKDYNNTLSIVMSLIDSDSQLSTATSPEHICGQNATIIDGPDTLGLAVYSRIQLGLFRTLQAIVSGKTLINIIAHSRGACEAKILTHHLEDIKNAHKDVDLTKILQEPSWISWIVGYCDSKLSRELGLYLRQNTDKIKTNIKNVEVNVFYLDPVPGGALNGLTIIEWKDTKFSEVPPIVQKCTEIIYTEERSAAFQPVISNPSTASTVNIIALPGNHGTGTGLFTDQRERLVPSQHPQLVSGAFKVQILICGKIIKFLKENGVVFQQPQHLGPVEQAQELNLRQIAHQILLYNPSQWNKKELKLYDDIDLAQQRGDFACLTECSYPTGMDRDSFFAKPFSERRTTVNSRSVGLEEGLKILGFSPAKGFRDSHHKKVWLQKFGFILLTARDPIQALKKIIDDIIKNNTSPLVRDNVDTVYVRKKDEIRFKTNKGSIVSSIFNAVKIMYFLDLFKSSDPQFTQQISRIICHYASKKVITDKIKCAIECSLLVRRSNLSIGQRMTRFQFMQELSAQFTTPIHPDIQLTVLADIVFYLPKQNYESGLYFLPQLDESTHALLPLALSNRLREFNLLAPPAIPLLKEERNHPLPKNYPLLAAALGSLLIFAAALAANIASPTGISIGVIIIAGLASKLYQTYFSTHQESNLSAQLGVFSSQ